MALALCHSAALAQSYGPQQQVLTIGGAEFENMSNFGYYYIHGDGYLYTGNTSDYAAPLSLPEGSSIEGICLFAFDDNPAPLARVSTAVYAVKLVPTGETAIVKAVSPGVETTSNLGYEASCSAPFSYTVRSAVDIDGDGSPGSVAYYAIDHLGGDGRGVGGVRIKWRRQVSVPPATPTFEDVPASDATFPYIEALAASGVTAGCAGGNYCPDAGLTRRQMAVFLAKALGLHWEN
jgi:hypothetical protein